MGSRDEQRDWDDLPLQRARQPLGPDGIAQRRSRPLQRRPDQRRGTPRQGNTRPSARPTEPGRRPEDGSRSRLVAVVVLVVAAVIVVIGGIAATTGDVGSGSSVSISILPFPQNTDTTLAQ